MTGAAEPLLIRHGTVIDGSGAEPFAADVLLRGDRVERVGEIEPEAGWTEIDATGRYVTPGFIDIHSHSDYTLLVDPRAKSAIHQGVTLEVIGNCGHGCFPIRDPAVAGRAIYGYSNDLPATWETASGYFERLEEAGPAINVLSLVPNGQLRLAVVGLEPRPATTQELAAMTRLLEESLEQGAWGYSTGLEYAQEWGATEAELTALCTTSARRGGIYATHTRRRDEGAATAVEEAIRTARNADGRLQVSHLTPRSGAEETRLCAAVIDAAAASGVDVAFDMHTRLFGTTFLHAGLPPAILSEPPARQAELLRDPEIRRQIEAFESILSAGHDWSRVVLLDNDIVPQYGRRDLASIAEERGQTPVDALCDILIAGLPDTARLMIIIKCYTEAQQREIFAHPLCMPGSDATTLAPDGPLSGSMFHGAYTWAAWFFDFMVSSERLLTPQEAVHRLTGLPAERLGLRDRGVLRAGAAADVTVFDPEAMAARGTTFEPNQLAVGVDHVIVNGVLTLENGVLTGERAGQVLRKT